MKTSYKRAILKFSGEVLKDTNLGDAISHSTIKDLCCQISSLYAAGYELGIVVGGGNIFRGTTATQTCGSDRVTADCIGMLATVINAMALSDELQAINVPVEVFSALPMPNVCETYFPRRALKSLQEGKILLLSGGTGNAFFSTDSAAALRASELRADVIIKATKVDGVYDKDPKKYTDAIKFDKISFEDVLLRHLNVMDSTAFSLCMDNNIPIIVVNAEKDLKNIERALRGEFIGTTISNKV